MLKQNLKKNLERRKRYYHCILRMLNLKKCFPFFVLPDRLNRLDRPQRLDRFDRFDQTGACTRGRAYVWVLHPWGSFGASREAVGFSLHREFIALLIHYLFVFSSFWIFFSKKHAKNVKKRRFLKNHPESSVRLLTVYPESKVQPVRGGIAPKDGRNPQAMNFEF
jgi:hypothetical protein